MFQDLEYSVMMRFVLPVDGLGHLHLNQLNRAYKQRLNVVSLTPPYVLHYEHIRRTLRRLHRKE